LKNGNTDSNTFETTDIDFASFLYANDVPFIRLNWANTERASFVFETPSNDLLASWLKDYQELIRKMKVARNLLRDIVEGKR
jgi:hypothetical protein